MRERWRKLVGGCEIERLGALASKACSDGRAEVIHSEVSRKMRDSEEERVKQQNATAQCLLLSPPQRHSHRFLSPISPAIYISPVDTRGVTKNTRTLVRLSTIT